ncbi:hypothetical protein JOB18_001873 [Solea senegalensis]|uniref:Uncharacterized protein n=1 Tax=Solea senegalensis TaxID=28829 RepID=A0AAV6PRU5_SOLSE|nr:hypothetical protein JOB18_001873 [Solea senegalensis]
MVKSKPAVALEQRRHSPRLALLKPNPAPAETKKKAPAKKGPKARKVKPAENGKKAEEPKAEAAESK